MGFSESNISKYGSCFYYIYVQIYAGRRNQTYIIIKDVYLWEHE